MNIPTENTEQVWDKRFGMNSGAADSPPHVVLSCRGRQRLRRLAAVSAMLANTLVASHAFSQEIGTAQAAGVQIAHLSSQATQRENQASVAPQFEVASVRVVPPEKRGRVRVECAGADGSFVYEASVITHYSRSAVPRGRCVAESVPLRSLIAVAYDFPVQNVSGTTDWPNDIYNIEGKAENPGVARKEDLLQMLQSLLSDRFKLKFHMETKEGDGFVLLASANGVKFKEVSQQQDIAPPQPGQLSGNTLRLSGGFRLKQLANFLSSPTIAGLPVLDDTNLPATYAITLTLKPGPSRGAPGPTTSFNPPLDRAIEEQLGLKLERRKIPARFIVIDHVEKASAN